MKKCKNDFIETKIRLSPETHVYLKQLATKNHTPISSMVRQMISDSLAHDAATENIDVITTILRRIVRDIVKEETERLAKLIIKTMKASATGMYLASQAIEDIGQNKGGEMLEEALKMAAKYIKVAYDPKDYIDVPSKIADQLGTITDDDLFTMTI